MSSLSFAVRSPPTVPVLMKGASVATARCAIVASSVSPDRWGDDRVVAVLRREFDRVERVRQRPDLVRLDQDAVGRAAVDSLDETVGIGDEQVITADQRLVADFLGQFGEGIVIVLVEGILDVDEVVLLDEFGDVRDLLVRIAAPVAVFVRFRLGIVQFSAGDVQPEADVEADLVLDHRDRLGDDFEGLAVVDRRCPRALVALATGNTAFLEQVGDCGVDGRVREDRIFDARRADGCGEELLNVGRVGGVFAATDDITERNREALAAERATEVLKERRTQHVGTGFCSGHRDRDRAVCADLREVVGAVSSVERGVDVALIARIDLADEPGNGALPGRRDRLAWGSFDGFVLARAGPLVLRRGRNRRSRSRHPPRLLDSLASRGSDAVGCR